MIRNGFFAQRIYTRLCPEKAIDFVNLVERLIFINAGKYYASLMFFDVRTGHAFEYMNHISEESGRLSVIFWYRAIRKKKCTAIPPRMNI